MAVVSYSYLLLGSKNADGIFSIVSSHKSVIARSGLVMRELDILSNSLLFSPDVSMLEGTLYIFR